MMLRKIFLIVTFSFCFQYLSAQQEELIQSVVAPFENYQLQHFEEKIHLHTDKDQYFPKEIIWLKAYLTANNAASPLSTKLFIQLRSRDSVLVKAILPIKEGVAKGFIEIPDSLQAANYLLSAYTNWSEEQDERFHFRKQLTIGVGTEQGVPTTEEVVKITFYPEGGSLVNAVNNTVAYELLNDKGLPKDGEIEIFDDRDQLITKSKTSWQGKGIFKLRPEAGRSYYASIAGNKLERSSFAGEANINVGVELASTKNFIAARVTSNDTTSQNIHVLVSSYGKVVDVVSFTLRGSQLISFPIKKFSAGVQQFTFFNAALQPFAERLIFVYPDEIAKPLINVSKKQFKLRELTSLKISDSDKIREASVAVVDVSQAKEEGNENIYISTYLRPDIQGSLRGVESLFDPSRKVFNQRAIDLLMLVNGWRKYDWSKIKKYNTSQEEAIVVDQGITIKGNLTKLNKNKPIANEALLLVMSDTSSRIKEAITDASGNFVFENLSFTDSTELLFRLANPKKTTEVKFTLEELGDLKISSFPLEATTPNEEAEVIALINEKANYRDKVLDIYDFEGKTYVLDEAVVRSSRDLPSQNSLPRLYSNQARVLRFDDPNKYVGYDGARLANLISANFPGVQASPGVPPLFTISGQGVGDEPILFYLNNVRTTTDALLSLTVKEIESIELVKGSAAAVFGVNGTGGAILVYTKPNIQSQVNVQRNFLKTHLRGFQQYREFYSPDYSKEQDYIPDLRTTLYWNPDITLGTNVVSFYNHDNEGQIKVIMEGYNLDGAPFRVVEYYQVTK